jgi:hypothetical protein
MRRTGTEQRLMKVRQRAPRGMLRQILPQPLHLRRCRIATSHHLAFAVSYDDVPRAQIVASNPSWDRPQPLRNSEHNRRRRHCDTRGSPEPDACVV